MRVRVDGVELQAQVDGPDGATAVLLLNSIACDLSMWDPHVERLADRFRVIRYDARGHGRSGVSPVPFGLDDLGRDALAVMDGCGVERAHVVGISLGGLVALWLAIHHPGRVARLVAVATAARIGTPEGWRERAGVVTREGTGAVVDLQLSRFFTPTFRAARPEVVERVARGIASMSPEGYADMCLALAGADLRDGVDRITAPTLIVVGREDVATPVEEAEWLRDRISGSRLLVLEGAGHLCTLEQPEAFTDSLLGFLEGR